MKKNEIESSPSDVFSFDPSVKGKAVWVSTTVLKFVPEGDLPMREKIEGELNLQKLSQDFAERKLEELNFELVVIGREISSLTGNIELVDRNNPRKVVYSGRIIIY